MKKISKPSPNKQFFEFETCCYMNFMEFISIELGNLHNEDGMSSIGVEEGLMPFTIFGLAQSLSTYLFEALKYLELKEPGFISCIKSDPDYNNLVVFRNNMHPFSKKRGGYAKKGKNIIDSQLEEFKMKEPDWLFPYRNDISLVFQDNSKLLGADYYIYHCKYESDNSDWSGKNYQDYTTYLGKVLSSIYSNQVHTYYNLPGLMLKSKLPDIKLYDYKSERLFELSGFSKLTTLRLLLSLYQISCTLLIVDDLLEPNAFESDLWFCFFVKFIAINCDETVDNINSLAKFLKDEEKQKIQIVMDESGIDFSESHSENLFVQKLRNTIHYQEIQPGVKSYSNLAKNQILKIYMANTSTKTMEEFRAKGEEVFLLARKLQNLLQNIFLEISTVH